MDKRLQYHLDNPNEPVGEELAPMVEVARRLNNAPRPALNAAAKSRIEARLFASNIVPFQHHSTHRLLFRAVAAVLAIVLFVGSGTAWASDDALPGETLYPVKRLIEETRLSLATSDSTEINLRMDFAQRRLDEFDQLLDENDVELALIEDASEEVMRIQSLPYSETTRRDLIALSRKQQRLLKEAQTISPHNNTIQSLTSEIDDRLLNLRIPDLTVCDFEFWKAQPALWSDVVIILDGQMLDQSAILSSESDSLFEQYITMKLNVVVNNAAEFEFVAMAEEALTSSITENASADLATALAIHCEQQASSTDDDANADTAAQSDNDSSTSPTDPSNSGVFDCSNPPPPHAPAVGWREHCGVSGPEPGNGGNGQSNQNNRGNSGQSGQKTKEK